MERILCVGNFIGEICAPRKLGKMCKSAKGQGKITTIVKLPYWLTANLEIQLQLTITDTLVTEIRLERIWNLGPFLSLLSFSYAGNDGNNAYYR